MMKFVTLALVILTLVMIPSSDAQTVETIKIGGLFPLHDGYGGAGIERSSAFLMAIDNINSDPEILSDYFLEPVIGNTEADPIIGKQTAENMIEDGVVAIIGPATSRVAIEVASGPSKQFQIPMISYSATAIALSDIDLYPYFNRVVPSDYNQAIMLVDLLNYFNWDFVASIGTGDVYSSNVVSDLGDPGAVSPSVGIDVFEQQAENSGIEIAVSTRISDFDKDIDLALDDIEASGSNIIILSTVISDSRRILQKAHDRGINAENGYVWVGTDALAQEQVFSGSEEIQNVLQGALATRPIPGLGMKYESFLQMWAGCNSLNSTFYPLCGSSNPNLFTTYTYDATYLLAHALNEMIFEIGRIETGDVLQGYLRATTYDGITGLIDLDNQGDQAGNYEIVNLQDNTFVNVGRWTRNGGVVIEGTIFWDGNSMGSRTNVPPSVRNKLVSDPSIVLLAVFVVSMTRRIKKLN